MRILGIDPGTVKTGYGIIDILNNKIYYVSSGIIRIPAGQLPEKLQVIYSSIGQIIGEFKPTQVAIEEVFFAKNANTALKLGQARGASIVAATNAGVSVAEYAARLVKKTITGNGAATKDQINYMVRYILTLDASPQEDAADALAIAVCHYHHI